MKKNNILPISGLAIGGLLGGVSGAIIGGIIGSLLQEITCPVCGAIMKRIRIGLMKCPRCGYEMRDI